jgi:hypothetical protein
MTKAWDWQDLINRLKANGLVIAEKEVKDITNNVLDWTSESLALEGGVVATIAVPAIQLAKPYILQLEDKIDGVSGN